MHNLWSQFENRCNNLSMEILKESEEIAFLTETHLSGIKVS